MKKTEKKKQSSRSPGTDGSGMKPGRNIKATGPNWFQPNSMSVALLGITPEGLKPLSLERPKKGQGVTVNIQPGSVHGFDCVHRAPERSVPSAIAEGKIIEVHEASGLMLAEVKVSRHTIELYPYDETLYVTINGKGARFPEDVKLGLHCERPDLKILGPKTAMHGSELKASLHRDPENSCCFRAPVDGFGNR